MSKHNKTARDKRQRNLEYAMKYAQRTCRNCGHKSSKRGRCKLCNGEMHAPRLK